MKQKYKLLPIQVENLRKQYDENLLKLKALNVIKSEEFIDKKNVNGQELNVGIDVSLLGTLTVTVKDYNDAKEKLKNYEVIEPNNSDVIDLGSSFEIALKAGDSFIKKVFTLVEVNNVCDGPDLISVSTPIGKAVLGSKVGDEISYIVNDRKITGNITDIIKEHKKTL